MLILHANEYNHHNEAESILKFSIMEIIVKLACPLIKSGEALPGMFYLTFLL
jgi:hypothetical protein